MYEDKRKLQLVELKLLKNFIEICEKNDIRYYALGGTLLGAVRHKGFIPWDDDIDIGVPREDYDRLLKLYENESKNEIDLHSYKNDPNHYRFFSQIEDSSIKVNRTDKLERETSSAWIDIFPLDGMPNGKILRKIWKYYILYLRAMYRYSCFNIGVNVNKKNRPLHESLLIKLGVLFNFQEKLDVKKRLGILEKALKKYPYKDSQYLVNAMGAYKFKEMFHKKYYGDGEKYLFEDIKIWGPIDYDYVCRQLYGDYMKLPPENERNHHESEVILDDLD